MGSFCSGTQNTTQHTSQEQNTNQQAQNQVQGTSGGTTTPFLQWLGTEAANMGAPFGTAGTPFLAASAAPVTAGNIESLAYPLAGQEFNTAYQAMLPSIQDQTKAIEESMSDNPGSSAIPGALGRYYSTVNANLANLAQGLTAGAYNAGIPVAEANQAALARAGMGINTGNLGWLGTVPGLISTAGNTFANQFGQTGQSSSTGQTTGEGTTTGQTQWTPSYMSMLGSLFSMPSLFGGGGGSGGAAAGAGSFGGDIMSGIGSGLSWLGGLFAADGGPIRGYAGGGGVEADDRTARFADEVKRHFHAFHALRKHAESGGREHHADLPGAVGGDAGWSAGTTVTGSGAEGSAQRDQADDAAQDAADDAAKNPIKPTNPFEDKGPRHVDPPPTLWDPRPNEAAHILATEMANARRNAMGAPRYDIGGEVISAEAPSLGFGNADVDSAQNTLKAVDNASADKVGGPDLTKDPVYKLALLDAMKPWSHAGVTPLTSAHGGKVIGHDHPFDGHNVMIPTLERYALGGGRVGFQEAGAVKDPTADAANVVAARDAADDAAEDAKEDVTGVSPEGLNFISNREGFSNKAYWDHNGNRWSIGFGTPASGPDDYVGSREEGQERLRHTMAPVSDWINKNIRPLSQPQHDALASFAMNAGFDNLAKLKDDINAGKDISGRMMTFNHAHDTHEVMRGLTARRGLEASMYTTGKYPSADDVARAGASATSSGEEGYTPRPDNRNFLQRWGDNLQGRGPPGGDSGYGGRGSSAGYYAQNPNYVKSGAAANDTLRMYGRDPLRDWFAAFGENSGIPNVPGMTHGQLANLQNRSDFLLKQQEAAGSLFSPTGGYAPTLRAQEAAGMININGQMYPTAQSIEGQKQIAAYKAPLEKDLAMFPNLLLEYNKISSDEQWGVYSSDPAENRRIADARRMQVWQNYQRLKEGIHAAPGTPSAAPVKPQQPQPTQKMSDEYIARQKNLAKAAIESGRDPDLVNQRLRDKGITP